MKWSNLKKNVCPKCDKDFMQGLKTTAELRDSHRGKGQLLSHPCGFSIHEHRYQQIVSSQVIDRIERQLEHEYAEET